MGLEGKIQLRQGEKFLPEEEEKEGTNSSLKETFVLSFIARIN